MRAIFDVRIGSLKVQQRKSSITVLECIYLGLSLHTD